jgi:hypothetical protein
MAKRTRPTRNMSAAPAPFARAGFRICQPAGDPFETNYMGVLRTNDPLLLERGNGSVEMYRDLQARWQGI